MPETLAERASRILPPDKPARNSVHWSEDECRQLAAVAFAGRHKEPGASLVSLVNRAQQQLPQDRRRKIATIGNIAGVVRLIQEQEAKLAADAAEAAGLRQRLETFRGAPASPSEWLARLADDDLRRVALARVLQLATVDDVLSLFPAETLLEAIATGELVAVAAKRAFAALAERPVSVAIAPAEPAAASQPHASNGRRPPKIVIIGVKGQQPLAIRQRVKEPAELIFVDANSVKPDNLPGSAAAVVLWARFISHACESCVRNAYGPAKIKVYSGGIDNLANLVNRLAKDCAL